MSTVGQRRRLSNPESRAQFLYEARGESAAALKSYLEGNGNSLTRQHNLALLTYLANNRKTKDQTYQTALRTLRSQNDKGGESKSDARVPLHEMVLSYNLAIHAFYSREYETAKSIIFPICQSILNYEGGMEDVVYGDVKCKIAFLVIDCMLEIFDIGFIGNILNWIERYVTFRSVASTGDENCNVDQTISFQQESDVELKFRLHCYRARYLFMCAEEDRSSLELNLKRARKELKNAMEIYNHNLSAKKINGESVEDGTASIQDSVSPSVDSGHGTANEHHRHKNIAFLSNGISNGNSIDAAVTNHNVEDNQTPYELRLSNDRNQHALFLKAKLEYLKGNCNKSMKLCSEAQNASDKNPSDDTTNILHATYNNNMGLVHQSAGQFYLAMHYYALALSCIEIPEHESDYTLVDGVAVHIDGTMKQIPVEQMLYNAAICSQACGNYVGSCECMIRFIQLSTKCSKHPLPWLHLSESYIGLYNSMKSGGGNCSHDEHQMDDNSMLNPLTTAVTCLTRCMALCQESPFPSSDMKKKILESARVSLAFVWLELNNPAPVACLADAVLREELPTNQSDRTISQRLRATIRLYACEAMTLMGNPRGGLKYLPDDQVNDVVDFMLDQSSSNDNHDVKDTIIASISGMKRLADEIDGTK